MLTFKLKKFRDDRKLTQQQVADLFEVPQSSISSIENGKLGITIAQIELLMANYEFNLLEYLTESENRNGDIAMRNTRGKQQFESIEGVDPKTHKEVVAMAHTSYQSYMASLSEANAELRKVHEDLSAAQAEARQFEKQLLELRLALATKGITL